MDMCKLFMLIIGFTMVNTNNDNNNVTRSNESDLTKMTKIDFEMEMKKLPPGYYFVPSYCMLILDFLVKKIMGLPLPFELVKAMDDVQLLDPEQHNFKDEFAHCQQDSAYYITNKAERKTEEAEEEGGGSKTRTVIKTTSGYWRETKKDIAVVNDNDQIIGYRTTYNFWRGENDETLWRMDEFTVNPETIPAEYRDQIEENIACWIRVEETDEPPLEGYEVSEDEDE